MPDEYNYLYGPVPSRRLGRSLGIDIVPLKVCTLDCIYCQLGRSPVVSIERRDYVAAEAVLDEMAEKAAGGLEADFITIAGSGEPTLNSDLGKIVKGIREITNIPVGILTNGTLLYRPDVRADCATADVLMPSLDAGDEETFERINRPHKDISIEKLVSGLCAFREEFAGEIWLEVFIVEGLNSDADQIRKIKGLIDRIRPDKIHVNTAVRPTAEANVRKVEAEKLGAIARQLGECCEVIADLGPDLPARHVTTGPEDVLSMLKRRPCSVTNVCRGLGISCDEAARQLAELEGRGLIESHEKNKQHFFKAK